MAALMEYHDDEDEMFMTTGPNLNMKTRNKIT